jgi:hypothetical protein
MHSLETPSITERRPVIWSMIDKFLKVVLNEYPDLKKFSASETLKIKSNYFVKLIFLPLTNGRFEKYSRNQMTAFHQGQTP